MSIRARMETAGVRACIEDMRAIDHAPERAKARLDAVLDEAFVRTQFAAPVRTGFLRSTGQRWSEITAEGDWEGTIQYGPVEYIYWALNGENAENGNRMDAAIASVEEDFEEVLRDVFTQR